jgi:hypothetical protein
MESLHSSVERSVLIPIASSAEGRVPLCKKAGAFRGGLCLEEIPGAVSSVSPSIELGADDRGPGTQTPKGLARSKHYNVGDRSNADKNPGQRVRICKHRT